MIPAPDPCPLEFTGIWRAGTLHIYSQSISYWRTTMGASLEKTETQKATPWKVWKDGTELFNALHGIVR